jgi:hypothetical protein
MKLDNSNKRISNIIAGILLVFMALVFIATALGVVGYHLYIQDKMDPLKSGSHYNLEDKSTDLTLSGDLEKNDFVSVAQYDYGVCRYDTVPGSIVQVQEDLCLDFLFPLCIDPNDPYMNSLFDYWYKVYQVTGGYEPCDQLPQLWNLYQWDKDTDTWVIVGTDTQYIGWSLTWVEITETDLQAGFFDPDGNGPHVGFDLDPQNFADDCCSIDYWVCIIDWATCENEGCIDANKDPYGNEIPDKYLELDIISGWTGCGEPDQCFVFILVQISRIPNSRINI